MRRDPLACARPFAHVGSAAARNRSPQNWVMSCPRPSSTSRRSAPSAPVHGDRRHRRHAMQRMDPGRAHTAVASSTASGPRARMEPRPASIATALTRAIRRRPSAPRRSSAASLPSSPAASSPACCAHDAGVHVLAGGSVPWLRVAGRCRGTAAVHTRRWTKQSDRDEPHEKAPCAAYAHLSQTANIIHPYSSTCRPLVFRYSAKESEPVRDSTLLFCRSTAVQLLAEWHCGESRQQTSRAG